MKQADVVGLLTVGSKAKPNEEVLQIGDAGTKQLTEIKTEGEETGLAAYFKKQKSAAGSVLGPGGLPPMPSGLYLGSTTGVKDYIMDDKTTNGYPAQ